MTHCLRLQCRQDRPEFRCGLVDFVVGVGFGDDSAARMGEGGAAVGRQLRAPDRHHPASVAALIAPAHRARVETAVALELADQSCGGIGGRTAHRRGRMQRDREIQCGGGLFAQPTADRCGQVPDRGGAGQCRGRRDLQIDAQRIQRLAHRVDDQLVLVAVLGRRGERLAAGPVRVGIGRSRRGTGERCADHALAVARHQQLGAGADQRGPRVVGARRGQVGEIGGGGGVGGGKPVDDGARIERPVGGQPQRAGQHHLVQFGRRVPQPLQRRCDPARDARRARAASRRSARRAAGAAARSAARR